MTAGLGEKVPRNDMQSDFISFRDHHDVHTGTARKNCATIRAEVFPFPKAVGVHQEDC